MEACRVFVDHGLLESALYRPQTGHYADLAEMAGARFESRIMNHPFMDGKRCIAFFATDVFLRLNGYQLKADAHEAQRFLVGLLENNRCNFDELLPWLRRHVV